MFRKDKHKIDILIRLASILIIIIAFFLWASTSFAENLDQDLFHAARNNDVDIVRALIVNGANVNARGDLLSTPLIVACKFGSTESAIALLEAGAEINVKCFRECTPLMYSVKSDYLKTVKMR